MLSASRTVLRRCAMTTEVLGAMKIVQGFGQEARERDRFAGAVERTFAAARRRIRIRDGARHWTLLRDLNVEQLWIERYHVATWTEYVRHNQRRTKADAALSDRIRALHKGPVPFVVHRMIERQTGSLPEPQTREIDEGIG